MVLSEFIYGGMDGVITTVAIIAGTMGANIAPKYALILGLSNIMADGFSMGISRYNSLVDIVKSNANSELALRSPLMSAIMTFIFFVLMGSIPLLPFVFDIKTEFIQHYLLVSSLLAFLIIGLIKGLTTKKYLKSLGEIIIIGSIGALISYHVASKVKNYV